MTEDENLADGMLIGYHVKNTRDAYRRDLEDWFEWCGGQPLTAERRDVDDYIEFRSIKPSTLARRLSAINAYYKYCISMGRLTVNPMSGVRRPKVSDESTSIGLSKDELGIILAYSRTQTATEEALAHLLGMNGLRVSEAIGLDIEDFTVEGGIFCVKVTRKGGKVQLIPLNAATVTATATLRWRARTGGPIFYRMTRQKAWKIMGDLSEKAIGRRVNPHAYRHTYVTLSLEAGVPLEKVQRAAGHASPTTTMRYAHSRDDIHNNPTFVLEKFLTDNDNCGKVES